MRRTARALSVAALAGAVVGAPASAAFADPAAEVSPGSVPPGGSITVSVTCDALGGAAPATLEATSQAFEEGTVELKRVSGSDGKAAGAAYRGTARVPPAENFEGDPDAAGPESAWTVDGTCPAAGGGEGKEWSATFTVAGESGSGKGGVDGGKGAESGGHQSGTSGTTGGAGESGWGGSGGQGGTEGGGRTCTEPPSDWTGAEKPEAGQSEPGWDGTEAEGTGAGGTGIGGTGTGADESGAGTGTGGTGTGGIEPEWDTSDAGETDPHANAAEPSLDESGLHSGKGESAGQDCAGAGDQHGVQAGTGGTFTDSVPALVAGGLLMAGAFGGAVYRLRRRRPTTED